MSKIALYYVAGSPPCRSVMLTAKALGVSLNKISLDIHNGEQNKPEFVAVNPQHCVPTIVDGTFKLWESRAILSYLAGKFDKSDKLYPNDIEKRATVNWMLYFDACTFFPRMSKYIVDLVFDYGPLDPNKLESFFEAVDWLDKFIGDKKFTAADHITIADHALIATMTQMDPFELDLSNHKNVAAWIQRCKKEMEGYQTENQKGVDDFEALVKSKLAEP